jgi:hypothetical protein
MNKSHEKKARRIATLLAGYMRDNLTPPEHDELDEWVGSSDRNMRLFEELTDERRVQLALELLNDNSRGLVNKLNHDNEFKFASSPWRQCKNYIRRLISGQLSVIRRSNRILKNNRQIIHELCKGKRTPINISKKQLERLGFSFEHCTSVRMQESEIIFSCYEYHYIIQENESLFIDRAM